MAASGADIGGSSGLSNLGNWTVVQLRELAKRIGLGGYSRMDKTGLLDAVSEALPKGTPLAIAIEQDIAPSTTTQQAAPGASELASCVFPPGHSVARNSPSC